jgi:hypothetical protein
MNLGEIRRRAVALSGRYDLITDETSFDDEGMNDYIFAAQRYLDRLSPERDGSSRLYYPVTPGSSYFTFPRKRAIKDVFCHANNGDKTQLILYDWEMFITKFASVTSAYDRGKPAFYAMPTPKLEYIIPPSSFGSYFDGFDPNGVDGVIVFAPAADNHYIIELHGDFYGELSDDSSESYWSREHPEILVWATCRSIEVAYRNTAGVNDWTAAIKQELFEIDKDGVEELVHEIVHIRDYP